MIDHRRAWAVGILERVFQEKLPLDDVMSEVLASSRLEQGDRAWLQDVCAGVLRWKGRLDLALDRSSTRTPPRSRIRTSMLAAIYQLIAQDRVSPARVVDEWVDFLRQEGGEPVSRFANAVLRRISRELNTWKGSGEDLPHAQLGAWWSMPPWIWDRLVSERGLENTIRIAEASLKRPETWVRMRDSRASEVSLPGGEAGPVSGSWRLAEGGRIDQLTGFKDAAFLVQDLSSQTLVAEVTRACRDHWGSLEGKILLDWCAAPGGKSIGLAWSGWQVIATDHNPDRRADLEQNVARLVDPRDAGSVRVVDFRDLLSGTDRVDALWVDAPCTGTGTLGRHPEIRWNRKEADLRSLMTVQREVVTTALKHLRPGGVFIYSVCSLLEDEGIRVLQDLGIKESRRIDLAPGVDQWLGDGFAAFICFGYN